MLHRPRPLGLESHFSSLLLTPLACSLACRPAELALARSAAGGLPLSWPRQMSDHRAPPASRRGRALSRPSAFMSEPQVARPTRLIYMKMLAGRHLEQPEHRQSARTDDLRRRKQVGSGGPSWAPKLARWLAGDLHAHKLSWANFIWAARLMHWRATLARSLARAHQSQSSAGHLRPAAANAARNGSAAAAHCLLCSALLGSPERPARLSVRLSVWSRTKLLCLLAFCSQFAATFWLARPLPAHLARA